MIIYHVLVIIIYNTHSLLNHLIFILLIIKILLMMDILVFEIFIFII